MDFHDIAVKRMLDNLGSISLSPIYGCYIKSDKVSDDEAIKELNNVTKYLTDQTLSSTNEAPK